MRYYQIATRIGGVDAGECDAPIRITWPSEVDAFKARIAPTGAAYDASVKACANLPPDERSSWDTFYAAFVKHVTTPTSTFGSYGEWVTTCGFAHTLDAWGEKLRKYCKLAGPENISSGGALDVVKIVAGAVVVVSVAAVAITYGPTLLALIPRRRA